MESFESKIRNFTLGKYQQITQEVEQAGEKLVQIKERKNRQLK
jgi:hypothetical protein